jgi:hypothetical protein
MTPVLKQLTTTIDLWLLSSMRYLPGLPVLWLAWWLVRRPGGAKRLARIGELASLGLAMAGFSVLYTFGVVVLSGIVYLQTRQLMRART